MCEIGVDFSFAALWVFRLRRAEAASAVWIPHWHSEPCESQGTRAAKGYVNGNLGFRNLLGARRGLRGQFSVQSDNRFSGRGGGGGEPPQGVRSEERRVGKEGGYRRWENGLDEYLDVV